MKTALAFSDLPAPQCRLGYPEQQLKETFSVLKLKEFFRWMRGQTFSECDGMQYSHETKEYSTGCGPHGFVYYVGDVQRFVDGRPIID